VEEAYQRSGTPSPGARDRLLERIGRLPRPRHAWGGWAWLTGGFAMVPAGVTAAAAVVLVAAGALTLRALGPSSGVPGGAATSPAHLAESPLVRFELAAAGAARVTLVGDFNGWDRQATPMRRAQAPGVWTVSVPLPRGRHAYGFVVDDERWVADPSAPLAPEDGFGGVNSVIVVNGPGAS
jgi:hypothetical protein